MEVQGIMLDKNMNFQTNIKNICRNAGHKSKRSVDIISPYLNQGKKIIMQGNDEILV